MKILSLFDGMSVAQQALKNAGLEVESYYASEIDEYAIAVTQSNFPNTIQIGDVSKIHGHTEPFDLLIGGSPCQDLSIAKKNREGLKGQRSGLFYEYVRILNENNPKYFILENVASMPKEAREQISEILGVQPIMINASLVSAQNRKRLFWIGKWNGEKYEQVEISQPEDRGILLKDILENGSVDRFKAYCIDANYWKGTNLESYLRKARRQVVMLTEQRTEEAKAIRRESIKEGKDYSPRRGKELVLRKDDKSNTITTGQTKESLIYQAVKLGNIFPSGGQSGNVFDINYKSTTLMALGGGSGAKTGLYMTKHKHETGAELEMIRKLTPIECLRLQSMPDDYFDKAIYKNKPISNTQRYKMCGNAFNCEVIVHILKHLWITN
jgi:DNA (cytosine-5)-methyltransferase 3A